MNAINLSTEYLQRFVTTDDLAQVVPEIQEAQRHLLKGDSLGNDFLGWIDLPEEIDEKLIEKIQTDVNRLAPKSRLFVVIGIGGSYLGARAVIEALQSEFAPLEKREFPYVAA